MWIILMVTWTRPYLHLRVVCQKTMAISWYKMNCSRKMIAEKRGIKKNELAKKKGL
jgi:hypothetical protein